MLHTIPSAVFEVAKLYGDHAALREKRGGQYHDITYAQLVDQVRRCAAGLRQLGLQPGDRVAVVAPNGTAWVVADLATMFAGGVTVPVHTTFSSALIRYVLEHSGASIVVAVGEGLLKKTAEAMRGLPAVRHLVVADTAIPEMAVVACHRWDDVIATAPLLAPAPLQPDDAASIVYTSGTTGLPHGVVLTHKNFLSNVTASMLAIPVYPTDLFLSFLPLSHVLEHMAGYLMPLTHGATIAFAENPSTLKENLLEVHPTILIAVPRVFEKFHDAVWAKANAGPAWRKRLFTWALRQRHGTWQHQLASRLVFAKVMRALGGRLRLSISGGAALHPPLAKFFDRVGVQIYEGYGLTETSPVITVNSPAKRKFGSVGIPLSGVQVRISHDKEVLARGENICAGYWQDEGATRELIDADGWLHTGDLGFIDPDEFLFIIGRRKEMLVTAGGKNIWPAVLENAMNNDSFIAQSMAVAHGKPYVAALVVPVWPVLLQEAQTQGWPADRKELLNHKGVRALYQERITKALADRPDFEQVRRFALLPDEFLAERDEVTPTQKLRRSVIERHYAKEIEGLYQIPPLAKGR